MYVLITKYLLVNRYGHPNKVVLSTLYNSKITSIDIDDFEDFSYRIDVLEESPEEIQEVVDVVRSGRRFEGENYTNGNLNRYV